MTYWMEREPQTHGEAPSCCVGAPGDRLDLRADLKDLIAFPLRLVSNGLAETGRLRA
jgi:hypothetical protein